VNKANQSDQHKKGGERTSYQSSIINHQPSTINHQPSIINHQPSTILKEIRSEIPSTLPEISPEDDQV